MANPITLTNEEAAEILKIANVVFIDELNCSQAQVGVMTLVDAMQKIGYRVTRPLKAVE